jgi:hypothetical protein
MIEKIVGLIFAIAGTCASLVFIFIGLFIITVHPGLVSIIAFVAIFLFSVLAMFISVCPLIGSFENKKVDDDYCPSEPDEPVEPEKEKLGFFAPFQLV